MLIKKFKLLAKYYLFGLVAISISLFLLSGFIIELLFGKGHDVSVLILQIMSLTLLFRPFGQLFTNYLIITKRNKIISRITLQTMLFNMILIVPLLHFFQEIGLAITILIVQIFQIILNIKQSKEIIL